MNECWFVYVCVCFAFLRMLMGLSVGGVWMCIRGCDFFSMHMMVVLCTYVFVFVCVSMHF